MIRVFKILIICLLIPCEIFAAEYVYILNDKCINELFYKAEAYFRDTEIIPFRDSSDGNREFYTRILWSKYKRI